MLSRSAQDCFNQISEVMYATGQHGFPKGKERIEILKNVIRQARAEIRSWKTTGTPRSRKPSDPLMAYTPGPYAYYRSSDGCDDTWEIVSDSTGDWITSFRFWDDPKTNSADQNEANACLLAASPNLLQALHGLIAVFESFPATIIDDRGFRALIKAKRACDQAVGRSE